MKKLLIILFLFIFAISIAGCGPMTPEQQMALSNSLMIYSQQQQNLAYQQNMQLRENAREINRQLQKPSNSSYWQEQRARQEYWQNWNK